MSGDKLASRSSSSRAFVEHGLVLPLIDTLAKIALRSGCRVEQGPHRQRRKHAQIVGVAPMISRLQAVAFRSYRVFR
jgi:hypothetical protein